MQFQAGKCHSLSASLSHVSRGHLAHKSGTNTASASGVDSMEDRRRQMRVLYSWMMHGASRWNVRANGSNIARYTYFPTKLLSPSKLCCCKLRLNARLKPIFPWRESQRVPQGNFAPTFPGHCTVSLPTSWTPRARQGGDKCPVSDWFNVLAASC